MPSVPKKHQLLPLGVARMDCLRHSHIFLGILSDEPLDDVSEVWEDLDEGKFFTPVETFEISFS